MSFLSRASIVVGNAFVNSVSNGLAIQTGFNLNPQKKERFETAEDSDSSGILLTFYVIIIIFFAIIYFAVMLGLWIRIVYYAFKSGPGEGISSIIFYQLYTMFKMGSFMDAHNNSKTSTIF
jgi:hypothetical protein